MKKRFSEEQIIKAIKQHEAGTKVEDICRQLGISNDTEFTSKAMFWSKETKVKLSFTHFRACLGYSYHLIGQRSVIAPVTFIFAAVP